MLNVHVDMTMVSIRFVCVCICFLYIFVYLGVFVNDQGLSCITFFYLSFSSVVLDSLYNINPKGLTRLGPKVTRAIS